jgi:putative endonuclease
MYYVYVLENIDDGKLYIRYSSNLRQRIRDHLSGKGSRLTKLGGHWKLIYYESYLCQTDAIGREKFLKGGSGRKYLNKQLKNYFGE